MQLKHKNSSSAVVWQGLRLEETLNILDQTTDLISVENFICILKNCRKRKKLVYAKRVYAHLCNKNQEDYRAVGNYVVPMFVECGSLSDAQWAFDRLVHRNEHSWTALISGYIHCGQFQCAFNLYQKMQEESIFPSSFTFIALMKACATLKDVETGRGIHVEITRSWYEGVATVGNTLVSMYAKCGLLSEAQEVFDKLQDREVVSWTALITGYAEHGPCQEALNCFERMQKEGINPDAHTFVCVLKACGSIGAIDKGREMHMKITTEGLERNPLVGNTLVDMYAKCGSLSEAQEAFDKQSVQEVVTWTALIAGYAEHGSGQEALKCFEQMQLQGTSPNAFTFFCILKGCGSIRATAEGRHMHTEVTKNVLEKDVLVGSALVGMYAKCGLLLEAQEVLVMLPFQKVVPWTSLIVGCMEHGAIQEALSCFEDMQVEGIPADVVTFVCLLKACGSIGTINKGREIHMEVTLNGFQGYPLVGNTLVNMYTKCGSVSESQEIFDKMPVRDVVSWNALIAGYAVSHEEEKGFQCFVHMQEEGTMPNAVTFTCLLNICSLASLLSKGQEYFKLMREKFGIAPTIEHYNCMVDLLARSGHLLEAERFLEGISCPLSERTWRALLSGCKNHGEAELGLRCFQQLVKMNEEDSASYVLMAGLYANAGRWDEAYTIEELRNCVGAKKKPASAVIEVNNKVQELLVGDNYWMESFVVLEVLSSQLKKGGYVPNLDLVL